MVASKERQAHLKELRKAESSDTKLCPACEGILPLSAFSKESRNRKGLAAQCKACVQADRFEKLGTDPETAARIRKQAEARPLETENTKSCSVCCRILPLYKFSKAKGKRKDRTTECKRCRKEYKAKTKERNRWVDLYRKYGITREQFEEMLKGQQGKCKICLTTDSGRYEFEVDHCHTTGKVRALLCHRCNKAIGLMGDNVNTALAAAKYLEEN